MGKTKYVVGVPRWIQDPPSEAVKKLIKKHCYSFIETLAQKDKMPTSATDTIPGFLEVLVDGDKSFKNFNANHLVTTYKLIDYIRGSLKNNMKSV